MGRFHGKAGPATLEANPLVSAKPTDTCRLVCSLLRDPELEKAEYWYIKQLL
jgi:hypothetical protein